MLKKFFRSFGEGLRNLLLSDKRYTCSSCQDEIFEKESFCKSCLASFEFNNDTVCSSCGRKLEGSYLCTTCKASPNEFDVCRSAFIYKEPISELIHLMKYRRKKYLANDFLPFLVETYLKHSILASVVLYVPMMKKDERKRGYNQGKVLAKLLAKKMGLAICHDALVKTRKTEKQMTLSKADREKNLKGAFKVLNILKIQDKNVLLVDDVFTTGTTANECAKVLKKAGAKSVSVLTIASTPVQSKLF